MTTNRPGVSYVQPSAGVGVRQLTVRIHLTLLWPALRFEFAQTVGDWSYSQVTVDYRRYDGILGPVVLATRLLYFGRIGRDANQFRIFAGSTELIRGNTSGSYYDNECRSANDIGTETGCVELDRLVGTQFGVASAELRFPIQTPRFGILPNGFPPLEGAIFYDIGVAWDARSTLQWNRRAWRSPHPGSHALADGRLLAPH